MIKIRPAEADDCLGCAKVSRIEKSARNIPVF